MRPWHSLSCSTVAGGKGASYLPASKANQKAQNSPAKDQGPGLGNVDRLLLTDGCFIEAVNIRKGLETLNLFSVTLRGL